MPNKKRRILKIVIPAVSLLLIAGGVWWLLAKFGHPKGADSIPEEPTYSPRPTFNFGSPGPTGSPGASATPNPNDIGEGEYRLPLVPVWDEATPQPTAPVPTATPAPTATIKPLTGVYNDSCRDIMVVGIENNRAAAILLTRVKGENLSIISLPVQTLAEVYVLDSDLKVKATKKAAVGDALAMAEGGGEQSLWNLAWAVKNLLGVKMPQYVGLDLSCLPDILKTLGEVKGARQTFTYDNYEKLLKNEWGLKQDALADFGVGIRNKLAQVSIWELPALRTATKGKICTSLSTLELISLANALKKSEVLHCEEVPTIVDLAGDRVLTVSAAKLIEQVFDN